MIKACIFDLDGVICDTAKYHFIAWQHIAQKLGIEFNEIDNESLKGVSRVDSLSQILKKGNITITDEEFEKALIEKNDEYLSLVSQMQPDEILPGVEEFLVSLQENDIKIVLGSASKNAPLILDKIGLTHYFEATIDGNQVDKGKPSPEVFLKGAKAVNVAPEYTVVFEDAVAGVEAANRGDFMSVGVGNDHVLRNAKLVISGFENFNLAMLQAKFDKHIKVA
jgi:beta-phosphoglucomutase